MKVIIAGSRHITDYRIVADAMREFPEEVTEVVSGMAKGVDKLGEEWAKNRGIPIKRFRARWDIHGKSAGPIRNREMAVYIGPEGALVAIWDGLSSGTRNMIAEANKRGLQVYVFNIGPVTSAAQTPGITAESRQSRLGP